MPVYAEKAEIIEPAWADDPSPPQAKIDYKKRAEARRRPLEANEWMAYFYMHRDMRGLPKVLDTLLEDGRLSDAKSQAPLSAFFAQVFRRESQTAKDWLFSANLNRQNARPLVYALWMAGDGESARHLGRKVGMGASTLDSFGLTPPNLLLMPITGPAQMDILWGAFMGSGDVRYVQRILDIALTPVAEDDENGRLLRQLAGWSLRSNWRQHGAVWMYSLRQVLARQGEQRALLQAMIKRFRGERRLPHGKDSDLGALLLTHRDAGLQKRWRGPSEKFPRIKVSREASPGDSLELELLFSGTELDEGLVANVRYDVEVTDPLGKPWLQMQDLVASDQPVPSGWFIQRAKDRVLLRFGEKDPVGKYLIKATVRDLVAESAFVTAGWVELGLTAWNERKDPLVQE